MDVVIFVMIVYVISGVIAHKITRKKTLEDALSQGGIAERAYRVCEGCPVEYSEDYNWAKDDSGTWHDIRPKDK